MEPCSVHMDYYFENDLHDAIVNGNVKSVESYLKCGLCVNHAFQGREHMERFGRTLLDVAVNHCQTGVLCLLIQHGCDVNLKYIVDVVNFRHKIKVYKKSDKLKLMSFYSSIVRNNIDVIKILVQGGYDVNIKDERGCTALWHAVDLNNYAMAKVMVSAKGCDVNLPDVTMLRPLHVAALHGSARITSLLVRKGAIIDALQLRGSSPLILAAKSGSYETCRLLLLNGADPNLVGYNGHTAVSTSLQVCSDRRLVDMLIEAGAYCDHSLLAKENMDKQLVLKHHPELVDILRILAGTPRSLKTQTCLVIRRQVLASRSGLDLIKKIATLPLPKIIQEFLLLYYL